MTKSKEELLAHKREIKRKSAAKHRIKYNEKARLKRKLDKIRFMNTTLKYKYGITVQIYNEMLEKQQNKCAICNIVEHSVDIPLCVDHNHHTNKVRGLLCKKCNSALGLFKESLNTIKKAINYLEEYNGENKSFTE